MRWKTRGFHFDTGRSRRRTRPPTLPFDASLQTLHERAGGGVGARAMTHPGRCASFSDNAHTHGLADGESWRQRTSSAASTPLSEGAAPRTSHNRPHCSWDEWARLARYCLLGGQLRTSIWAHFTWPCPPPPLSGAAAFLRFCFWLFCGGLNAATQTVGIDRHSTHNWFPGTQFEPMARQTLRWFLF